MDTRDPQQPTPHEREVAEEEAEQSGRRPDDVERNAFERPEPTTYEKEVEAEREGTTGDEIERKDDEDTGEAARWYTG